jgi:hypothetical protein
MNAQQRESALVAMRALATGFYAEATKIGVHPFIEFCGLMNEYIKACQIAHDQGIDFSACNVHSGQPLPLESFMVDYINQKLACIFSGRSVMANTQGAASSSDDLQ